MVRFFWIAFLALFGCSQNQEDASEARASGSGWSVPGGDAGKTYFSPLDKINRANVNTLGLAWEFDLETGRGQEATPVVVDGVMIVSSNLGRVYAIDAKTGAEIWRFVPQVDMQVNRTVCCDQVNRGVAIRDGRVYVASLDAVLYALDFATGKVLWKANTIDGEDRGQHISGAPEIAGDVVVIGNGGAEFGVRGYVSAYDLETGDFRWRFYTVPRDPKKGPQENPELEEALATWGEDARWEMGMGGTVWDAIHYDAEFDAVYIGVGNGGPYHYKKRAPSGGDQLFLSSLVALDPQNGRVKWYYQQTPGDSWDYTATQPMVLTELEIDGEIVPVLMHAPKNGFLYLFDRRNGKLLKANPIAYQNWADGVDPETGRPNVREDLVDYIDTPRIVFPATPGTRNWHPASYNSETGLYYASISEVGNLMFTFPGYPPYLPKSVTHDAQLVYTSDLLNMLPALPPPIREAVEQSPELERVKNGKTGGYLRAIDPLTGETRWEVENSSWQDRAGVLSTAGGLVFNGDVTGRFSIYDTTSGELLHRIETGTSIVAAPMTFLQDGEQYVAVTAGWGGGGWPYVPRQSAAYKYENRGRLLVFRLGGVEVPMPQERPPLEVAPEPPPVPEGADLANGTALFFQHCTLCHAHSPRTISADLRRMRPETHAIFEQILLDGVFVGAGMPRWNDVFSKEDARDIHAYLITEQQRVRAQELKLQKEGLPLDAEPSRVLSSY